MILKSVVAISGILSLNLSCAGKLETERPMNDEKNPVVLMETSAGKIYLELFEQDAPETVKNFTELAEGTKEFTEPDSDTKAKRPFYDGLVFHRVIKNFMVQGGCPKGNGTGHPGFRFKDEINANSIGLDTMKAENVTFNLSREVQMYISRKLGLRSQADLAAKQAQIQVELDSVRQISLKELYEAIGYSYDPSLRSHKAERGSLAMANSGPNTNGSQFFINHVDTPHLNGKHTVFGQVVKGMDVVDAICNAEVDAQSKPKSPIKIVSVRVYQKSKHKA